MKAKEKSVQLNISIPAIVAAAATLLCMSTLAAADCPEDLTGDGEVGGADLGTLLSAWGPCENPDDCPEDLTGDDEVGGADLGTLLSAWGPCPADICPPDAIDEGEMCGDETTDGCNMDQPNFGPSLTCGESVCGSAWAEDGLRDTDWYPFTVDEEATQVTWAVEAQFDATVLIIDANEGCIDEPDILASETGPNASAEACLAPGDYWLLVSVNGFNDLPCSAEQNDYVATVESCVVDPKICDFFEPSNCCEPEPGQVGCEDDNCEAAVCDVDPFCCNIEWDSGCANIAEDECGGLCDFVPPQCSPSAGDCCEANGTPGCNDPTCCAAVCECDPFCCDDTWDRFCAGDDLMPGDCSAAALCDSCGGSGCEFNCPPDGLTEPEPCGGEANDGCNLDTPAFTPIEVGDTYCGTVWAEDQLRDTDWYEVTVDQPSTITWEVDAAFDSVLFIAGGSCGDLDILATTFDDCPNVAEADVTAGTYWVIVTPNTFEGLPCDDGNNEYTATVSVTAGQGCGAPGTGDCCEANGTPYCDDAACCEAVCFCDPFCCDVEWDEFCAGPNPNFPGCSALELCDQCE